MNGVPPPDAAQSRLRMRLSLRWKAFGLLLLLLGAVHAFYGFYAFHQALDAFTSDESERMRRSRQMLDGMLRQSTQSLGRIAAQLASGVSADELARRPLDESRISPELLASLSDVQVFNSSGLRLGGFSTPGAAALPTGVQTRLLGAVQRQHRPASTLRCEVECGLYVFAPAFDRNGREILVGLSQPASEILAAFSRQSGIDVALLSDQSGSADSLFQRRIYAITNAPTLLPRLQTAALGLKTLPTDQTVSTSYRRVSLMLLLSPLSQGATGSIYTLFVSDESPALARIGTAMRHGLAISFGGLLLSSAALWWFLTPLSRRLWRITRALPMLADKRFAEASAMLGAEPGPLRFADELDLLNANARWLTRRLKQLDQAEAASAAKSRFLATLSHEVRTPLNGILGLLEVLQHSQLDPGQRESIGMVRDSAQSLLGILNDTIDLARIEAGRVELEQAPFSIEQVVAGCAETAAARARGKGLRLLEYTDPALPPRVIGDATRLRQVLNNLCSNAVKFTASGRIIVRAELAGRSDSRLRVRFSVQDTGIGIPPEQQRSLFQPFEQGGGGSTTARYGGSGLGLSICQGLVLRMGGKIGFVSNPGVGSEFSFWLEFTPAPGTVADAAPPLAGIDLDLKLSDPDERAWIAACLRAAGAGIVKGSRMQLREEGNLDLLLEAPGVSPRRLQRPLHRLGLLRAIAEAIGQSQPGPAAPEAPARRLRILAVDDHPTNREVIQRQLTLLGHQPSTAMDAAEALQLLGAGQFDLLLTDLRMPGMDGVELVGAIRKLEGSGQLRGRLPVVVLSAQLTPAETERCLAAGIDACLTKPAAMDDLRRALVRWSGSPAPVVAATPDIATTGAHTPVLDRAVLSNLLGGDEAMADLMLGDFLRINTPLMADLTALAGAGRREALAAAAHRLLGSARTIGAAPLAQALAAVETAAAQAPVEALGKLAAAAAECYAEIRRELQPVNG